MIYALIFILSTSPLSSSAQEEANPYSPIVIAEYTNAYSLAVFDGQKSRGLVCTPLQGDGPWNNARFGFWHAKQLRLATEVGIDILAVDTSLPVSDFVDVCRALLEGIREEEAAGRSTPQLCLAFSGHISKEHTTHSEALIPPAYWAQIRRNGELIGRIAVVDHQIQFLNASPPSPPRLATICASPPDSPWMRKAGSYARDSWREALNAKPDWLYLQGWNDYGGGRQMTPSREFGYTYYDLAKIGISQFKGQSEYRATLAQFSGPTEVAFQGLPQFPLVLRNSGRTAWSFRAGLSLRADLVSSEALAASITIPISGATLPNRTYATTLGFPLLDSFGKPLPTGDYSLRLYFQGPNGSELLASQPLQISPASSEARLVLERAELPDSLASGSQRNVDITIRNIGGKVFLGKLASFGYKLFYPDSVAPGRLADAPSRAVLIGQDLLPGQLITLRVPVKIDWPAMSANWSGEVRLAWDVFDGKQWGHPAAKGLGYSQVRVSPQPGRARIRESSFPQTVSFNSGPVDTKVLIENTGDVSLTPERHAIGYRWYYLDGFTHSPVGNPTPLEVELWPGQPGVVRTTVRPPARAGLYYLVWELFEDNVGSLYKGRDDILVQFVEVVGAPYVFVDLSKYYNADFIAADDSAADGDAGRKRVILASGLPADVLERNVTTRAYPCGYKLNGHQDWSSSPTRAWFALPPKEDGAQNAVICRGQDVAVLPGNYSAIHIVAASLDGSQKATFRMDYGAEGSDDADLQISPLDGIAQFGEHAAFAAPLLSPDGLLGTAKLYHYVLRPDPKLTLKKLRLPDTPAIAVLAVTLEAYGYAP